MPNLFDHLSTPQCWQEVLTGDVETGSSMLCSTSAALYSKYCDKHSTPASREVARTINLLVAQARDEWLKDVTALQLGAVPDPAWRTVDNGAEIVQVALQGTTPGKSYSYRWAGEGLLTPGDKVVIPPNDYVGFPSTGVVVGFGTSYQGKLTTLNERSAQG